MVKAFLAAVLLGLGLVGFAKAGTLAEPTELVTVEDGG